MLQSEFVARWARDRKLAFIGDGDAISVCVAYLKARGIIDYGPSEIVVFDFDERICNAIERFADRERLEGLPPRRGQSGRRVLAFELQKTEVRAWQRLKGRD